MSLIPFKFPPGMARPGTVYEAKNRWFDGNLVRWFGARGVTVMQAFDGWDTMSHSGGVIDVNEVVRGMHVWRRNSGAPLLGFGTPTKLYIFGTSTLTDRTPSGFTTGSAHSAQVSGAFGTGAFGRGPFGVGDEAEDVLVDAVWWQFDNYHEDLVAWASSDRRIFLYDTSVGGIAAPLTNAPTNNAGVVVTPENFVVALGPGGIPRNIQWPDVDDPTVWTPSATNFAGDTTIKSQGRIITGRATSRETLIWTDVDVHALRFVGGEFVYAAQRMGTASLISGRAVAVFDDKAVWMGDGSFYLYDGEVKPIPSEVSDYVFKDLNRTQAAKIHSVVLSKYQEVIWFYPSGASLECNRYVAYNWLNGGMYLGQLDRTSGVDAGIYPYPIMADSGGSLYRHEIPGATYLNPAGSALTPYAESGPFELGQGDAVMDILEYIPDEKSLGDVALSLITSYYPLGTETVNGPFSAANPTPLRLNARQMRLKIEQVRHGWRFGVPRFDLQPGEMR